VGGLSRARNICEPHLRFGTLTAQWEMPLEHFLQILRGWVYRLLEQPSGSDYWGIVASR
jgi:hypothetical protein